MLTWKDIIHFTEKGNLKPAKRVVRTKQQWQEILTAKQFKITRLKGTELAHSGTLCSMFDAGVYRCVCCNIILFDASIKYHSKSGWPSFTQPFLKNSIKYEKDVSLGIMRVEIMCNTCDAHLGHVFPDGPEPSGLRYCVNSESIQLEKKTDE